MTPSLAHLARLTDETGIVEHARGPVPRRELGWCTDDNGRALALVCRMPEDPRAAGLAERYLAFLVDAHLDAGRFRLRRGGDGRWTEDPPSDDASGRALHGLAVAAAAGPLPLRATAWRLFDEAVTFRSSHPRAMAHAAVAAAEALTVGPHGGASALLRDAAGTLPRPAADDAWPWPADRLTYANALIPEGLLAAAAVTGDDGLRADALRLLAWLWREESIGERFSFSPTAGRGRGDARPAYDQQPIEAASFADAFARAYETTGDPVWLEGLTQAVAWVEGRNDAGVPLLDPFTDGGFDGLTPGGVNRNEGAESTIAVLSTLLQGRRLLGQRTASRAESSAVSDTTAAPTARSAAPYVR